MQLICTNVLPVPIGHATHKAAVATTFGVRYCPSMDLIAVFPQMLPSEAAIYATDAKQSTTNDPYAEDDEEVLIDVYRLNGQKAFTIGIDNDGGSIGIVDVSWRDDGVILAIATTDNRVRLVNAFSSKTVHVYSSLSALPARSSSPTILRSPSSKRKLIRCENGPNKRRCRPTALAYSTQLSNSTLVKGQLTDATKEKGIVLDDLLGLNADVEQLLKVKADLPKELANIDVEQFLPRLATLPATAFGEEDVFSTRTSIDAIFHPTKHSAHTTRTDVVVISASDAHMHVRLFDSFEIGDVDLNGTLNLPAVTRLSQVSKVITHPLSEKIYVLVKEQTISTPSRSTRSHGITDNSHAALHLLSLELRFLQQSPLAFPILATKATQLHNLIRYLTQIESQLAREVNTAFDLPGRFIRNLEEDLKEQEGEGATFETAAYHALLTGQIDGKYKEWLSEVLGERGAKRWEKAVYDCLELVRRLVNENWNPAVERAGIVVSRLSGLAAADDTFGVDRRVFDSLKDSIDVMAIIGEDLLHDVNVEINGFIAFMKWLRKEVEMASLEDTSEKLDEMREGSDHGDVRKVMKYVSGRLQNTSVKKYIRDEANITGLNTAEEDGSFYNDFQKARQAKTANTPPPSLKALTTRLRHQCDQLFCQVAMQLREGMLVQYVSKLSDDLDGSILDARIVYQPEYPVLHVISRHKDSRVELCCVRKTLEAKNAVENAASERIALEDAKEILDLKIVDDEEAMILAASHPYAKLHVINLRDYSQETIKHVFGGADDQYTKAGLIARKLETNGRKGRRTVTMLDEHGRGYGVFDLDSTGIGEDGDDKVMSG